MSIDYEARQAMLHEPCTHPHVALEHGTVTAPGMVQTSMDEAPVATAGQTDTAETGRVLWVGTERIFLPGSSLGLVALLSRLAALEADTGWVDASLEAGHTGYLSYRRRGSMCEARLSVTRTAGDFTTAWTPIGTLPAPARPTAGDRYWGFAGSSASAAPAQVTVAASGVVSVRAGTTLNDTIEARIPLYLVAA